MDHFKGLESTMITVFITACLISAVFGWGIIEALIWVFSHISVSFV